MNAAHHARLIRASGMLVEARPLRSVALNEIVTIGPDALLGEVIRLDDDRATIQVYEETGGLMLDSERAINACMASAARELGHALPESLWLQMTGGGDGLCHRLLSAHIGGPASDVLLERAEVLYDAVADAGIPHRPGVVDLLEWLVARGIPRAVATSTRRPLAMRKLAAAGLLPYFDAVSTRSDVARAKPAPDIYLLAASRLGVADSSARV